MQRRFNQRQIDVGQLKLPCLGICWTSRPSRPLRQVFNLLLKDLLHYFFNLLSVFKLLIQLAKHAPAARRSTEREPQHQEHAQRQQDCNNGRHHAAFARLASAN